MITGMTPQIRVGAGVGIRAVATIIDFIIFFVVGFIIGGITGEGDATGFALGTLSSCVLFFISIAYYVVMEVQMGGTVGKLAVGLRVVREDGAQLDYQTALIRTLLRVVDGLFFYLVGAILVWTSATNQRLGDRVAKTLVVSKNAVGATTVQSDPTQRF
jgi:uncharacterized RDD family membrane protein YckC